MAGTLPFVAIAAYEITIGKFNDPGVYEWQILVGPPLWAAACAFRVGAGRAAQIALVGWLTAAILWWALWFLLIGIGGGA